MLDLRKSAVLVKNTLTGGDKKEYKSALKSSKKNALSDCKQLKGKAKRQCKKTVKKNYRVSKRNGIHGGDTLLKRVVNTVGKPLLSIGGAALTGGVGSVASGLLTPKQDAFGLSPKGLKATSMSGVKINWKDVLDDAKGIIDKRILGTDNTNEDGTSTVTKPSALVETWNKFVSKVKQPIVWGSAVALGVVILVYRMFKSRRL